MRVVRPTAVVLLPVIAVTGCELIESVFQLGFFIGLVIAAVIVGLLLKLFGRRGKTP